MNRCKQCGQEIWESETTCAECEERSTALVLRNDAPAASPSSHAGETFPALDKVEPKPASANASPFEAIFSEAALEPAKIRIKPAPADVKLEAFDEPPAPTDDELAAAAFAEDDFDPVLDYATRVAQQEAELVASPAPAVAHAAPALSAAPAAAATAVMEPPIMKSAPAASAPAVKAGRSNRKMLLAGLLVVLGGTLTFAMLRPAPDTYVPPTPAPVVAAPPPAAPKPAASAPAVTAPAVASPAPATAPAAAAGTAAPAPKPAAATPAPAAAPTPAVVAAPAPAAAAPKATSAPAPAPAAAPAVAPAVVTKSAPAPSPAPAPVASPAPAAAVKPSPAIAPAVVAAPAVASKWNAGNHDWLASNKKAVAFEVKSINRVAVWQGVSQPVLVVRCDAGKVQAFVYTASAIQMEPQDENHGVGIRFDDQPESSERWADSSEHDALFAPDGAAFAARIAGSSKLRFSYKPHNANRAVAEFPTSGLVQAMEPVAKQCGLK